MSAYSYSIGNAASNAAGAEALVQGAESQAGAIARHLHRGGIFGLGEAYVQGKWSAPDLDRVLYDAFTMPLAPRAALARLRWLGAIVDHQLFNRQSGRRAFEIGLEHYDLGNDLFRAMLDDTMTYTCGVWEHAATLHEAQEAKLELICRKLDLHPGMHVLDIGCGWGNFAHYAAERYGVKVTGITVSRQQADMARQRCRGLPVEIRFQDYRELHETFDRIVSIEMIEAVGRRNIAAFYRVVGRCLKDDGRFVLQAISGDTFSPSSNRRMDEFALWLLKNIFPNGYLPNQHELVAPRDTSLRIVGWQNFGPDYDRTLRAWATNFSAAWDQLQHRYDDAFARCWNFYLHGCMAAFRAGVIDVYQIVYTKGGGQQHGRLTGARE
jgi:cyclopropane-fatty-acyl-phospholipid synthase